LNKQKFTQIVRDYHDISADDRQKLHELAANFPYSQVIHTLVAKANIDGGTSIANKTLGFAAMYAADRSVLKAIISPSGSITPARKQESVVTKQKHTTAQEKENESITHEMQTGTKVSFDLQVMDEGIQPLRDQLIQDLNTLEESKASYLNWLNTPETSSQDDLPQDETEVKEAAPLKKPVSKPTPKKKAKKSAPKKKAIAKKTTETKEVATKIPVKKTTKKAAKPAAKKSVKETKTSKTKAPTKKATPKNDNTDQSSIIDNFISKEPSITAKASRKSPTNQEDLSQHSTEFNEDLVSENLAKILISQGKVDKAVDIYKKLIWKFPQKKTYFASQIEELKK